MILIPDKVAMLLWALDVRDRHDLGILLEDITTKSGLIEEWDNVRSNMSRFTKREYWLGNEEKKIQKSEPIHRTGLEDQPRSSEATVEKTISPTTME